MKYKIVSTIAVIFILLVLYVLGGCGRTDINSNYSEQNIEAN